MDATFNAIREIFPHTADLVLFSVGAVTEGTDAQAKTTVRLEENGKMVDGQGADSDTIVASARAYIHALNKLLVKRRTHRAGGAVGLTSGGGRLCRLPAASVIAVEPAVAFDRPDARPVIRSGRGHAGRSGSGINIG